MNEPATNQDLRHEMEFLRRDMREMEQRLVIKLGGLIVGSIGIVVALVKLL